MLAAGLLSHVDILKVGHHGSRTASSQAFLQATTPDVAVYTAGIGNSYGHPHPETITALNQIGAITFGTDKNGTIEIKTDGNSYNIAISCGTVGTSVPVITTSTSSTSQPAGTDIVYITATGSKYHRAGCRYLSKSSIPISKADAIARGYTPCSICKP